MAYDIYLIPIIFAKCKYVFSNIKLLITDWRAQIRDNIIEVSEYLKA